MNAADYALLRLARSHNKHRKAFPLITASYMDLLGAYTDFMRVVTNMHLNGTPLDPIQVEDLHNRAMASVSTFRDGMNLVRSESTENSNEDEKKENT